MTIGPSSSTIKVFPKLPPANEDTFQNSLIINSTEQYVEAAVLYYPDLQNVGVLDNTASEASSSYSKTVTTGFSFTASQSVNISTTVGVNIEIVTASFTFGISISFSETTSKSTAVTIQADVPAGKKAFIYQGTLNTIVLRSDNTTGQFHYGAAGRYLTEGLTTSAAPLTVKPG
jgi:hypothetical protein